MCRIVLAFLFPKIFGGNSTKGSTGASGAIGSENHNKYGYARSTSPSRRQSWKPYTGPADGTSRSTAAHPGDDASEEFILTSVQRHGSSDDQDGAIRKTTKYEISYESDSYKN
jgi:hypothetical protein